jgi:hypothetical protein
MGVGMQKLYVCAADLYVGMLLGSCIAIHEIAAKADCWLVSVPVRVIETPGFLDVSIDGLPWPEL